LKFKELETIDAVYLMRTSWEFDDGVLTKTASSKDSSFSNNDGDVHGKGNGVLDCPLQARCSNDSKRLRKLIAAVDGRRRRRVPLPSSLSPLSRQEDCAIANHAADVR
jgi:hypothetical protein